MGLRSTLSAILSAPLAAALESKVRQAAEDALRSQDLADPSQVRELANHVDLVRRAIDELKSEIAECRDTVAALAEDEDGIDPTDELMLRIAGLNARDEELAESLQSATSKVDAIATELVDLRKGLDAASSRSAAAQAVASDAGASAKATQKAVTPPRTGKGCKVEGCEGNHRARGFCGRHYQLWKRDNLPGFVGSKGSVIFEDDGPAYQVDAKLAGKPATLKGNRIRVDEAWVSADLA